MVLGLINGNGDKTVIKLSKNTAQFIPFIQGLKDARFYGFKRLLILIK